MVEKSVFRRKLAMATFPIQVIRKTVVEKMDTYRLLGDFYRDDDIPDTRCLQKFRNSHIRIHVL
jgi:hypothetical protein